MAEQRQGDIQRLVRSIVADLMSQEQNTPVEAATSNTSGNRYESIDQELNNSFRIPRGTSRENISGSINTRVHNYLPHISEGANSWGERGNMYSSIT